MEVRKGYKQTEVGIIPDDWDVKPLDTISFVTSGKRLPLGKSLTDDETPHPYIRVTDMRMGTVELSDIKFVPNDVFSAIKRYRIFKNDIFISVAGTLGIVGKIPLELDGANLTENADRLTNITSSRDYLLHILMSPLIQNTIEALQTVGAQPKLALTRIRKFDIPIPPTLAEQEAIAEALSDADALIEAVEQLLTKKRQVKQGAMQELLKPKSNWSPTNLGSIADPNKKWSYTGGPFGSNLKASDYTDDGIRVIQLQNIGDGEFKAEYEVFTSKQKADELLSCNIYPGEIILSKMGDPVARACIIPPLRRRYVMCSDGIRLAVDQKRFNTYFVYTVINAKEFRTKAESAGVGSTRKRIGLTELRNLELFCPPLPEQTAIAEILSDMDAEITALEGKLSKARQVKAGMMSELLTGRIRLV
jgi:type I restriction enzyme S subunit